MKIYATTLAVGIILGLFMVRLQVWSAIIAIVALVAFCAWDAWRYATTPHTEPEPDYDLDAWPGMLLHRADGQDDDDDELPYQPIVHNETVYTTNNWQHNDSGKKPLWPSDIGGLE